MPEQEEAKGEVEGNADENRPLDQSEMEQVVVGGGDSFEADPADALDLNDAELRQRVFEELTEQQGS